METIIEKTTPITIARAEYIEAELNIHLHGTDAHQGRPIALFLGGLVLLFFGEVHVK